MKHVLVFIAAALCTVAAVHIDRGVALFAQNPPVSPCSCTFVNGTGGNLPFDVPTAGGTVANNLICTSTSSSGQCSVAGNLTLTTSCGIQAAWAFPSTSGLSPTPVPVPFIVSVPSVDNFACGEPGTAGLTYQLGWYCAGPTIYLCEGTFFCNPL